MAEVWAPIEGYEGKYEVSDQGRVRSLLTDTILKQFRRNHRNGQYLAVTLYNGRKLNHSVHRLVAIAHVPNPEGKTEVHHIRGRDDNRAESLCWASRNENEWYKQVEDEFKKGTTECRDACCEHHNQVEPFGFCSLDERRRKGCNNGNANDM